MIIHKTFGLDLGTTNSTASVVLDNEVVFAVEEKIRKNKTIPSIVAITKKDIEVVGTKAKNEFYSGNINSKKSIKRDMGKDLKIKLGKEKLTPEEISAKIIKYCSDCLNQTINVPKNVIYDKVVITVPAYFSLAQKDATRKAGELAGFKVQMLLEEPTAAAINYAIKNNIESGTFFVFDLGGGTFDISILEKTGNIPQVLATAGNNFLGGDNFDLLLARYFLDYLKETGYDVSDVKVDANNQKFKCLLLLAENVKKQLSSQDVLEIHYQDIFKDNSVRDLDIEEFTQEDFNKIIKEKVEIDIINECEKALKLLEQNNNKTIEDITHIIMVGGSSKIQYVKDVIKNKYCVTNNLKDVICFEPDLSVSAGAGLIANSIGYSVEDEQNGYYVDFNAPFNVEEQIYISGQIIKGDISKIGIKTPKGELITEINEDKTFMIIMGKEDYCDSLEFIFYDKKGSSNKVVNEDNSMVDIIAPTPVQNETIAVEIVDLEKGVVEKFPIVPTGAMLPNDSVEYFKINEYSNEKIILPIWEGPRKIFDLVINLPKQVKIGSRISVKTHVDVVSNVSLEVELNGEILNGEYIYVQQKDVNKKKVEELDEVFEERIKYVDDKEEKEQLIKNKSDIDRELEEASSNNDTGHYNTVSEKFEKMVTEMPANKILEEEDFEEIGKKIKSKLNSHTNIDAAEVDNIVFYGKRFVNKNNQEEARRCMNELEIMYASADILSSPKKYYLEIKNMVNLMLVKAIMYIEKVGEADPISTRINEEYSKIHEEFEELQEKYNENSKECEDMRECANRLIQIIHPIYQILETISPEDSSVSAFKGLVSKA